MGRYDSIATSQFYKDTGFDLVCSWLSENCLSILNQNNFKNLKPDVDHLLIQNIQQNTQELLSSYNRKKPIPLNAIPNLTDWIDSLNITDFQLSNLNFQNLYQFFILCENIKRNIINEKFPIWSIICKDLIDSKLHIKSIEKIFDTNFQIKDSASSELKKLSRSVIKTEQNISTTMQKIFTTAKSNDWLGGDNIVLRNGRKAIPIKTTHKNKIKGIIQDQSSTGQTTYIEPISIIELNNKLSELYFSIEEEKKHILRELTKLFKPHHNKIKESFNILVSLDNYNTRAKFAYEFNGIIPKINTDSIITIEEGLNPLFILANKKIVPLNIQLQKEKILLISGPNAGGKTVALKSIGLFALMVQAGLFIPAKKINFPIYTQFSSDIGDHQSIEDDLSTFSAHIQNISKIYENANSTSLLLLDELGTGTDPKEGAALSQSILESLLNKNSTVISTTHLGTLKVWASNTKGIINAGMVFNSKTLSPTYELKLGVPGASYGLEIAKRMGLNNKLIEKAKQLVGDNNLNYEKILEELEKKQLEAEALEKQLEERQISLEVKESNIISKQNDINKKHKDAKSAAIKEAEQIIISYRRKSEKLIEEIRTKKADKVTVKKIKTNFQESLDILNNQIDDSSSNHTSIDLSDAQKGQEVYISHLNSNGTIISAPNKKNKVRVEANGKTLTLNLNELQKINPTIIKKNKTTKSLSVHKTSSIKKITLDLRGERMDEALIKTEQHIDSAILSGLAFIYVLHGKGSGILKNAIHEYLKSQKIVSKFYLADEDHGGAGVTIVEL